MVALDVAPPTEIGDTIPANTAHAVSVTLPTWAATVAYEEGESWVASRMSSGYPRFCIHFRIKELERWLEGAYGCEDEACMIFPAAAPAKRCRDFLRARTGDTPPPRVRVVQLATPQTADACAAHIVALFFPSDLYCVAKEYWQHTGEGVSSRLAEYFLDYYLRDEDSKDQETYVEERFGRNLDISRAEEAKAALRTRVAHQLSTNYPGVQAEHVFLYPSGMAAIFSAHRMSLCYNNSEALGLKSVCFGFPYADTLKVLQKWGPGAIFYPHGSEEELDQLEQFLDEGGRIACLFCEFPSNPLLRSPNLLRIHEMAKKYGFMVIVDDTVGNMSNISVLAYVDATVSSLTKIFSGDCNVMAGALVLNHKGPRYAELQKVLQEQYVDLFWAMDAIYLERNSRDFVARSHRINSNAEAVVELLRGNDLVEEVYYPKGSPTAANYDAVKVPNGGYGGLLSVVFKNPKAAMAFFDRIKIAKGPSLGTNFTLACPYAIIAHYSELDFVESCGVSRHLIRISIGLEETSRLLDRFRSGLTLASSL